MVPGTPQISILNPINMGWIVGAAVAEREIPNQFELKLNYEIYEDTPTLTITIENNGLANVDVYFSLKLKGLVKPDIIFAAT